MPGEGINPTYGRNGKMNTSASSADDADTAATQAKGKDGQPLDREETARVKELKQTDCHVRAHEMAHLAAGAGLVKGGASYTYKQGPDGKLYAVSGEVSIDTSEGGTPRETITRMQRVKAAALAPSDPSPQDRAIAAAASAKLAEAAHELAIENSRQAQEGMGPSEPADGTAGNHAVAAYRKGMQPEKARGHAFRTVV